jgi:membrane complex biogenesis BtpA family protein
MIPGLRGVIGVVHLPAMPGDPRYQRGPGGFAAAEWHALGDADALARGGASAIIVENFGSAPFVKGSEGSRLPPHQVAALARICTAVARATSLPVGVNCLRNDVISALGIAAACDLAFVRVNVHVGAYVTDQGIIEGEADRSLRYRDELDARGIAILADVLVKHASPLAPTTPETATQDCLERGLADGVIVTGERTGAAASVEVLRRVRAAAGDRVVLVGSGVTAENAAELAAVADGAIVGTSLKKDGDVRSPVDEVRVRALVAAWKKSARR